MKQRVLGHDNAEVATLLKTSPCCLRQPSAKGGRTLFAESLHVLHATLEPDHLTT